MKNARTQLLIINRNTWKYTLKEKNEKILLVSGIEPGFYFRRERLNQFFRCWPSIVRTIGDLLGINDSGNHSESFGSPLPTRLVSVGVVHQLLPSGRGLIH